MRWFLILALAIFAVPAAAQMAPSRVSGSDELLRRIRQEIGPRVRQVEALGVRGVSTQDGRSFALIWSPAARPEGWIVTLHGSHSWAYEEMFRWQPFAQKRNLGVIALQWWLGGGESNQDYLPPPLVRRELETLLREAGAAPSQTVLHGFSRGAANLYAIAGLDQNTRTPLFRNFIANAGGFSADYPPNRDLVAGRFGPTPLRNTSWWLWCGALDPNPDRDGCPAMQRTREQIEQLGAKAVLSQDAGGRHGGFHLREANIEAALDHFFPPR